MSEPSYSITPCQCETKAGATVKSLPDYLSQIKKVTAVLDEKKLKIARLIIPPEHKQPLRKELTTVQVHPFRVYGDLANLSKTIGGVIQGTPR